MVLRMDDVLHVLGDVDKHLEDFVAEYVKLVGTDGVDILCTTSVAASLPQVTAVSVMARPICCILSTWLRKPYG